MSKYILMFASVHLPFAFGMRLLLLMLGTPSASGAGVVAIYVASMVVGSSFVKSQRRLYTEAERTTLRNGCLVYLLALDSLAVISASRSGVPLSGRALVVIIALSFLIDLFVLWMAQGFAVRRFMQKQLDRLSVLAK